MLLECIAFPITTSHYKAIAHQFHDIVSFSQCGARGGIWRLNTTDLSPSRALYIFSATYSFVISYICTSYRNSCR